MTTSNGDARDELRAADALLDAAEVRANAPRENRQLTAHEQSRIDAAHAQVATVRDGGEYDRRQAAVAELNRDLSRRAGAVTGGSLVERAAQFDAVRGITGQDRVYTGQQGAPYFFADPAASQRGDWNASQRLARNAEVQQRAMSTVSGAGGEFAPPGWLEAEFIAALRPARPTVEALPKFDMPPGVASLNVPRINTGTTVAEQAPRTPPFSRPTRRPVRLLPRW